MALVSKILFGIANSMLIPDIVLLILFFIRAIVMIFSTYSARRTYHIFLVRLSEHIACLTAESVHHLQELIPKRTPTLFTTYLTELLHRGGQTRLCRLSPHSLRARGRERFGERAY